MKLIRRIKAKNHGVPFFIKEHWQPFWHTFNSNRKLMNGSRVLKFKEYNRESDIVDLLEKCGWIHAYKITGQSRVPGDDHIASDKQFDLEYYSSRRTADR